MATKRIASTKKPAKRRQKPRTTKPRKRRKTAPVKTTLGPLLAILTLLYVLHLIDTKTYERITKPLHTKTKRKRKRR
ncbi:MAG TPA: hypothetical protein VE862_11260 [Candidatus Acidoferrum sp.]|nr:hypothetical protein [Candidatus Acidoferrum sp.]